MKNNIYDIAIIGSGLSTLTALKLLLSKQKNLKYVLFLVIKIMLKI